MLPSSPGELRFKRDTATLRAAERADEPAKRWSHARAFLATREAKNSLFPETACVPPRLPEPPTERVLLHTSTQESPLLLFVSDSQCDAVESSSSWSGRTEPDAEATPKLCPSPAARGRRGGDCLPPAVCIKIAKHQQVVCSTRLFLE